MNLTRGTKTGTSFKLFSISFWILLNMGLAYTLYKMYTETNITLPQLLLTGIFLLTLVNTYPYVVYRTILHEQKVHPEGSSEKSVPKYFFSKLFSSLIAKVALTAGILSGTYNIISWYILERNLFSNDPTAVLLILGYGMIGVAILCTWYFAKSEY